MKSYDTIIIGGGAAAYAAGIYAKRYEMSVLLIEEEPGGETALAWTVENYPGFKSIDGFELMQKMMEQAKDLGVEVVEGKATLVKNQHHCFQVSVDQETYQGKTIILATGSARRKLGLPREDELKGKGVHYCMTCDGPIYKGKIIAIAGGGDAAVKAGNLASEYGNQVYLIVREDNLKRAEPINLERLQKKSNVKIIFKTEVKEIVGEKFLSGVKLASGEELATDALFVEIGAIPRVDLAKELEVKLDERGYIDADPRTMLTNVDGVFAAGDVTNATGAFKQIVTGAAQGAIAATSAFKDLGDHGRDVCELHARPVT